MSTSSYKMTVTQLHSLGDEIAMRLSEKPDLKTVTLGPATSYVYTMQN